MKKNSKDNYIGVCFLLFGMALFGTATPISKLVGNEFPILTASFLRVTLGAVVLLPFVFKTLKSDIKKIRAKDWKWICAIAIFGMTGFTLFLVWGMKFITGVIGSLVMSLTPALTGAGAYLFLNSPLGWRRIAALVLGVIGVLSLNLFKDEFGFLPGFNSYIGIFLVFLAICCEATYTLVGKKMTDTVSPLLVTFLASILSIPLFFILSLFDIQSVQWAEVGWGTWLALSWWGICTLGLGSALWYSGLARSEGTTAAGFMAIMPVTALALSYFLLNEPFYWVHLVGVGCVLGSVAIMSVVHSDEH